MLTMRVTFFQPHPVYGATEYHLKTLAEKFDRDRYEVAIIYPDVSDLKVFEDISHISRFALPAYFFRPFD